MSAKKILVVFGATGNQGGSVIRSILNDPTATATFEIRAVTRDPSKPAAVALSEKGVATIKADLDDKDSLRSAVKDAYAVFAVTDWQEVMNKDREIQQGKNIADISKGLNVQHLIWSSLPHVSKISKGKYQKVFHFDSKAIVEEYIDSLGIPATFLHVGVFMSYILLNLVPTANEAKSYDLSYPFPIDTKIPLISVQKDTGTYVKSILQNREKFIGRQISAAEGEYTKEEIATIFKDVGGLDVSVPEEDMIENGKYFHEFGFFGGRELDNGSDILAEPLETFEQWVSTSPEVANMK